MRGVFRKPIVLGILRKKIDIAAAEPSARHRFKALVDRIEPELRERSLPPDRSPRAWCAGAAVGCPAEAAAGSIEINLEKRSFDPVSGIGLWQNRNLFAPDFS